MECVILRGQPPKWFKNYGYGDGYGSGYGYGDGYGSGDGDGYGYGDGDGDGSGDGDGYGSSYGDGSGDGSGDGYGSGDGDGSGSGYGYGDGSGDGYGDGSGYGSYWLKTIQYFAEKWSDAQRARLEELRARGVKIAFWRSNRDGTPANGGNWVSAKVGDVHKVRGPLALCTQRALHATLIPPKWKGERMWVVALLGEVIGGNEKYGALEREIIGECL
jgi:hypothetical protein